MEEQIDIVQYPRDTLVKMLGTGNLCFSLIQDALVIISWVLESDDWD